MTWRRVWVLVVGAMLLSAVPSAARMPDLRQMNGMALPSADLPDGSVSVRVVKQALGNNVVGTMVTVAGDGVTDSAPTDESGRAIFAGLGAGKTLVGLNVATRRRTFGEAHAVYLSGNGPLVAVLQEALTRDELARVGNTERKGSIRQRVKPFIQNVHHFRDEGVRTTNAPYDHVVIFDEAQRAWTQAKTSDFMRRRKKLANFDRSEPEFLISYLDRHETWAVIVCLVGGGQEIHAGEAGIGEWLDAVPELARSCVAEPHGFGVRRATGARASRVGGIGRVGRTPPPRHLHALVPIGEGLRLREGCSRL